MKILHTSDWHLGRTLYGKKRYEEFSTFLNWLIDTIDQENVDVLLVAGDIFDTTTPGNRAQALYYQFLCQVASSCCRHVVVIAGNHDSPSFLSAPKELLRSLNVYVVAAISEQLEDELIVLRDPQEDRPELIVCAVPFLRDRDVRMVEAGESIDDKELKLIAGIKSHYTELCDLAVKQQQLLEQTADKKIPIIGMGHLFAAGGRTVEGDGVRELYVGSIAHVSAAIFPDSIDYLALG
ncbi:MAG: exonuclease subunit SbcD, partial [Thiotrichaceae bacterium]|nr:exonuclease subunit SbcD [Thiotrichaceae bacterium]